MRAMPMDGSIDQYALAVVVYEWLCGVPPFQGLTPLEITVQHLHDPPLSFQGKTPTVPLGMERVVMKALSKESKQRFAMMKAFSRALAQGSLDTADGTAPPS